MKVDDRLHAHRKTRRAITSHTSKRRDSAAMGLWVLAGSWAGQNETNGWVPELELDRFDDDWESLSERLVTAGYWWPEERNSEPGFGFVNWSEYNPTEAAGVSGKYGNHVRWHEKRGIVDPDCPHCPEPPAVAPESGTNRPDDRPRVAPESGTDIAPESRNIAPPDPTRPEPDPIPSLRSGGAGGSAAPSAEVAVVEPPRPDVTALCDHLAQRITENTRRRPTITEAWRKQARLILDRDNRNPDEAHRLIDWCQSDPFWQSNILSMPKFREKYDQLLMQARRPARTPTRPRTTGDLSQAEWEQLAANLEPRSTA